MIAQRDLQKSSPRTSQLLFKAAWIVPAIAVLSAVLFLALGKSHLSEIGNHILMALIYSTAIGLPSMFLLNWFGYRYGDAVPRLLLFPIYAAMLACLATAGCYTGAVLAKFAGVTPAQTYWDEFCSSYPYSLLVTLTVGLSMCVYETMRHQLQEATLELRAWQLEQERANKLLAEARLSSLESRIHPHFLFNALNSIAALIPQDPRRAEDTVGKLASLLRASLNANHHGLVPLEQELKMVDDYLEIESTRFGPRLHYTISKPESCGSLQVPPLALQTLAENCVRHVAAERTQETSIEIAAKVADSRLILEVTDDGPGFSLESISPEHGLGNLAARLELLFGDAGRLDVARENGKCRVRVSFPAEQSS